MLKDDATAPHEDEPVTFDVLLSPPDTGELEQEYVLRALKSGWVAPAGPDLDAFEAEVAERVGRSYAVGLSSGTAALHLALVSWGVGPGDVVPVSTLTFAASVNAIRYVGADPHLVDCASSTGNIDPGLLDDCLSRLERDGRRIPAVIIVDMLGKCADYTHIEEVLATRPGTRLLSDSAESLGSVHAGRPAGSAGEAAVLSFNGNKVITTSGGGMLVTDDESLAAHVRKLSTQAREPVAHYEHTEIGYNYRLSNILAALGRAQVQRLDEMLARRRAWREGYRLVIRGAPGVSILGGEGDSDDNCWLTALVIDPDLAPKPAAELGHALAVAGIESRPVWKPMHLQPVHARVDRTVNGAAERLFNCGLALPSGSAMSKQEFSRVTSVIEEFVA